MGVECPECGNEYKGLGYHLAKADCDYPDLTTEQRQIIQGLMIGDGSINHHNEEQNGKPFLSVKMTNPVFLNWLKHKLKPHSTTISKAQGSEKSVKQPYVLRTIRSPKFKPFAKWYSSGKLELEQIKPSPTAMKIWYVSDGHKNSHGENRAPTLSISSRFVHADKSYFEELLEQIGITQCSMSDHAIAMRVVSSLKFWSYIGLPIPGFKNKWPCAEKLAELSNVGKSALGGNVRKEHNISDKAMNEIWRWIAKLDKWQQRRIEQRTEMPDEQTTLIP
jgi:hypothetical protein